MRLTNRSSVLIPSATVNSRKGGLGVGLIIVKLLRDVELPLIAATRWKVAAVRRFADRSLGNPAYPKVSRAQPP